MFTENLKKSSIFQLRKSHRAEKSKSGHLCTQNAWFLLKIEGRSLGLKTNLEKVA